MSLVAIDTNILVWGIRRQGPHEKQERAQWLFQELEESQAQVIVPTVALAEYLRPFNTAEQRTEIIAQFEERFLIMPFDTRCTSLAAWLFNKGQELRQSGVEGGRNQLNADSMIVATAAAAGAERLYSEDEGMRNLAAIWTRWDVRGLPEVAPDLFS
jgi:predicted nucleic acid-binding protein